MTTVPPVARLACTLPPCPLPAHRHTLPAQHTHQPAADKQWPSLASFCQSQRMNRALRVVVQQLITHELIFSVIEQRHCLACLLVTVPWGCELSSAGRCMCAGACARKLLIPQPASCCPASVALNVLFNQSGSQMLVWHHWHHWPLLLLLLLPDFLPAAAMMPRPDREVSEYPKSLFQSQQFARNCQITALPMRSTPCARTH